MESRSVRFRDFPRRQVTKRGHFFTRKVSCYIGKIFTHDSAIRFRSFPINNTYHFNINYLHIFVLGMCIAYFLARKFIRGS
jgi:hypothetical protein